jgi:tripartite-type tricarboxylate transporter receptor subunit TctC
MADLISGRMNVYYPSVQGAMPHVKSGKVRALGVTGSKRAEMLPAVPTIAEAALPGYELPSWMGVFGPAGMPREIVEKVNASIQQGINTPEIRSRMVNVGLEPEVSTPEQLAERLKNNQQTIAKIIRDAGIKLE